MCSAAAADPAAAAAAGSERDEKKSMMRAAVLHDCGRAKIRARGSPWCSCYSPSPRSRPRACSAPMPRTDVSCYCRTRRVLSPHTEVPQSPKKYPFYMIMKLFQYNNQGIGVFNLTASRQSRMRVVLPPPCSSWGAGRGRRGQGLATCAGRSFLQSRWESNMERRWYLPAACPCGASCRVVYSAGLYIGHLV